MKDQYTTGVAEEPFEQGLSEDVVHWGDWGRSGFFSASRGIEGWP